VLIGVGVEETRFCNIHDVLYNMQRTYLMDEIVLQKLTAQTCTYRLACQAYDDE